MQVLHAGFAAWWSVWIWTEAVRVQSVTLLNAEHVPLGRAAWGSIVSLSDERLAQPQQSWVCLPCSGDFQRQVTDGLLEEKANILFPA